MQTVLIPDLELDTLLPGPKLRTWLGISAVTLWRWRHDERLAFPAAKLINGRLYFPRREVSDWLARQRKAA
jgi:predicted DNA-binding transcriptional regulator AlpA